MNPRSRTHPRQAALAALSLLLLASTSAGCASNHAFPLGEALDVPRLAGELEARPKDEDALFDLTYLPGLHLDLKTFARTDGQLTYPEGHEYVSVRSWLPLFLFVDGGFAFFDADHTAYERGEFTALLWGLWARSEQTLQTSHGERVERSGRLLWFLDWEDAVEYRGTAHTTVRKSLLSQELVTAIASRDQAHLANPAPSD